MYIFPILILTVAIYQRTEKPPWTSLKSILSKNCSDLSLFENSRPSAPNFKSFSLSVEQFFSQKVRTILVTKYHFFFFLVADKKIFDKIYHFYHLAPRLCFFFSKCGWNVLKFKLGSPVSMSQEPFVKKGNDCWLVRHSGWVGKNGPSSPVGFLVQVVRVVRVVWLVWLVSTGPGYLDGKGGQGVVAETY